MSLEKAPFKLTKNEHIITELKRSKLPYVGIFTLSFSGAVFFFVTFLQMYGAGTSWFGSWMSIDESTSFKIASVFIALSLICIIFGLIAAYIYSANRMFITNEHIVLIKQYGIVATDKKVINHLNVEDAKFRQNIMGKHFDYGKLTVSTEAQNTVYELNFVKDPSEYANLIIDTRDQYQTDLVANGGKAIPFAEKR